MSDSETESSDEENLMTEVQSDPKYYGAGDNGELGAQSYERVVPANFAADSDDIFMRSMIQNFAVEGQNKDGSPNGNFFMTQSAAKQAEKEILATHKGIKGEALE